MSHLAPLHPSIPPSLHPFPLPFKASAKPRHPHPCRPLRPAHPLAASHFLPPGTIDRTVAPHPQPPLPFASRHHLHTSSHKHPTAPAQTLTSSRFQIPLPGSQLRVLLPLPRHLSANQRNFLPPPHLRGALSCCCESPIFFFFALCCNNALLHIHTTSPSLLAVACRPALCP